MKIIKRNGAEENFDISKIIMVDCDGCFRYYYDVFL